jgi:hypothetical protein
MERTSIYALTGWSFNVNQWLINKTPMKIPSIHASMLFSLNTLWVILKSSSNSDALSRNLNVL